MNPTRDPLVTHLLLQEWQERAQVPKPTALDTPLRYSSAHGCARQMGYNAFDAEPTEPVDAAGAWVMGVGSEVHELVQESIARHFPQAEFEVATKLGEFLSGSCDAYIPDTDIGNVLFELKTMGTFAFDKQVGWKRMGRKTVDPEGPKPGAITQAGLNAFGVEEKYGVTIDVLVLGSLTFEALSKNMATAMGISDMSRVMAEFHVPRDVWEPMAQAELDRMNEIGEVVQHGYLPRRMAVEDNGNVTELDPFGRFWQCDYCAFRTTCVNDGASLVYINDSKLTKREEL